MKFLKLNHPIKFICKLCQLNSGRYTLLIEANVPAYTQVRRIASLAVVCFVCALNAHVLLYESKENILRIENSQNSMEMKVLLLL